MTSFARKTIVTVFAGTALAVAGATPASAQPNQDGLVNVVVGDITIAEDVNIGVAALIAANVCDAVDVGSVAVLGRAVDRSGGDRTVCEADTGDVRLVQN